jgi:hypothetical protein
MREKHGECHDRTAQSDWNIGNKKFCWQSYILSGGDPKSKLKASILYLKRIIAPQSKQP